MFSCLPWPVPVAAVSEESLKSDTPGHTPAFDEWLAGYFWEPRFSLQKFWGHDFSLLALRQCDQNSVLAPAALVAGERCLAETGPPLRAAAERTGSALNELC